jgi:predicted TIM-barrel fold metal-dependent hydrolase
MEIEDALKSPVIDCHIHYPHPDMMDNLITIADQLKLDRFNIVCTPHQQRLSLVPDALHLKAHYPKRVFVFGGLNVAAYVIAPQQVGEIFAEYIDNLSAAGCDGIKMIEGKPDMRKMLPIPAFDSDAFAAFWEKAAEIQMPILFHVNDPEEFWDKDRAPSWALERGWFYGDGTFINNEDQYTEVINLLKRNPTLKITFAHFFFLSAQLPRLSNLLDEFPNISVDLTPGIEMYQNFAEDIQTARDFFIKYQGRILFGTDIGAKALLVDPSKGIEQGESHERVFLVRNFLENDGEFNLSPESGFLFGKPKKPFHGLGLPESILEKIYHKNFERIVGPVPRKINSTAVIELCNQVETMIQMQGSSQPNVPGDPSVVRLVRSFFEGLN